MARPRSRHRSQTRAVRKDRVEVVMARPEAEPDLVAGLKYRGIRPRLISVGGDDATGLDPRAGGFATRRLRRQLQQAGGVLDGHSPGPADHLPLRYGVLDHAQGDPRTNAGALPV